MWRTQATLAATKTEINADDDTANITTLSSGQYKYHYFGEAGRECSPAGCIIFFYFLFLPTKEI